MPANIGIPSRPDGPPSSLRSLELDLSESPWMDTAADKARYSFEGALNLRGYHIHGGLHKHLVDENTPEEIVAARDAILSIMKNPLEDSVVRLAAARLYLEHVIGKPRLRVDVEDTAPTMGVEAIMTAVMLALDDVPEIRIKVAAVLREVRLSLPSNAASP
jgi:hypothetical protein